MISKLNTSNITNIIGKKMIAVLKILLPLVTPVLFITSAQIKDKITETISDIIALAMKYFFLEIEKFISLFIKFSFHPVFILS